MIITTAIAEAAFAIITAMVCVIARESFIIVVIDATLSMTLKKFAASSNAIIEITKEAFIADSIVTDFTVTTAITISTSIAAMVYFITS